MTDTTESRRHSRTRALGLGATIGLAMALVVAFLAGICQASEVYASAITAPSPARMALSPNTPPESLLVATSTDFWPMEYISGTEIVGHDIDLMNIIAARMGVTLTYVNVSWGAIFQGLIAGQYDAIISSVSVTPDRDEVMDFTLPYATFAGDDSVAVVVQQGDDQLRQQLNETLWQLRADGTLDTFVANVAADVPDWQPSVPVWPYIPPDAESTLVYTDTNENPTVIQVPYGAVTDTVLLVYAAANTAKASPELAFAGHAFELEAYLNGALAPDFAFNAPVTVTITYSDTDLAGIDETTLRLNYWDDAASGWADAATTCTPHSAYDRRLDENSVTVAICHLSRFALFGQHRIYQPIVQRN